MLLTIFPGHFLKKVKIFKISPTKDKRKKILENFFVLKMSLTTFPEDFKKNS